MLTNTARDIVAVLWLFLLGTFRLACALIFVLPTEVLIAMIIGFGLMIVRDAFVYVPIEVSNHCDTAHLIAFCADGPRNRRRSCRRAGRD